MEITESSFHYRHQDAPYEFEVIFVAEGVYYALTGTEGGETTFERIVEDADWVVLDVADAPVGWQGEVEEAHLSDCEERDQDRIASFYGG